MRDRDARRIRPRLPAALLASALACLAAPAAAAAVTETFDHTGAAQSFTVPAGVTELTVDAYGGAGGNSAGDLTAGGLGGRATATVPVTPGEALQVNVGGAGQNGVPGGASAGGFNGGGDVSGCVGADNGGAGGGGSDLRRDADAAGGYELDERLVVAGGGGGAENTSNATGGTGGGTSGGDGGEGGNPASGTPGGGGTQSAGGAAGDSGADGQPGQLGAGAPSTNCAGAGGGGLYGGGSGAVGPGYGSGGGGGSGFTPAGTGMANGVHSGHGQVVLTYTPAPPGDTTPPPDGTTPPPDGTTPPTSTEFARRLGIAYSERKDRFKGKLASQSPACISGKRVKVFEQQKGKDPKLGADATDQRGRYSLKEENAKGNFYAQVNQRGVPGGTCLAARSETIKVG